MGRECGLVRGWRAGRLMCALGLGAGWANREAQVVGEQRRVPARAR